MPIELGDDHGSDGRVGGRLEGPADAACAVEIQGCVGEGSAGQTGFDVHVDGDGDPLRPIGQGGQMDDGAFDCLGAFLLFAEEACATAGSGRLVVEDEVLVTRDPAVVPDQEQGEIGVGAGEAE